MPEGIAATLRQQVIAAMLWQCAQRIAAMAPLRQYCNNTVLQQHCGNAHCKVLLQYCGNRGHCGNAFWYCSNTPIFSRCNYLQAERATRQRRPLLQLKTKQLMLLARHWKRLLQLGIWRGDEMGALYPRQTKRLFADL